MDHFARFTINPAVADTLCVHCSSPCAGPVSLDLDTQGTLATFHCLACARDFQVRSAPILVRHRCPLCSGLLVLAGAGFSNKNTWKVSRRCMKCAVDLRNHKTDTPILIYTI